MYSTVYCRILAEHSLAFYPKPKLSSLPAGRVRGDSAEDLRSSGFRLFGLRLWVLEFFGLRVEGFVCVCVFFFSWLWGIRAWAF